MNLHFLLRLLTLLIPFSAATSFYIRPFSDFTQTTQNIVRGTLSDVHATNLTTSDGQKAIYTYANVNVKEVFKGEINQHSIVVRKIGGTVDGYTVDIPSSPELKDGEDTVMFLSQQKEDGSYEITGLELGKFGLEEKNGETFLKGGLFNYSNSGTGEDAEHTKYADNLDENRKLWSLNALRDLIRKQKSLPAPTVTPKPVTQPNPVASSTVIPQQSPSAVLSDEKPSKSTATMPWGYGVAAIFLAAIFFVLFRKKQ